MELTQALDLGQVGALLVILWRLFLKNSDQTAETTKDVAVLKDKMRDISGDHDKIVRLESSYNALHHRVDNIEEKQKEVCKSLTKKVAA